MHFADIRSKVRSIILSVTAVIAVFMVFRIVIDFLELRNNNVFINFIKDISDIFISPFEGFVIISDTSDLSIINFDAIVGLVVYVFIGVLISELITSFLHDTVEDIIQNFIDAIFKVIESLLFIRIVFDFFYVETKSGFSNFIYSSTDWASGLIGNTELLDGRLNLSVILVLIIVVILDMVSEGFLNSLFGSVDKHDAPVKVTEKYEYQPIVSQPQQQPIHQNITIQVPQQQPQTLMPRNVTVVAPQPQQPIYQARPTLPYTQPVYMPYNQQQVPVQQPAQARVVTNTVVRKKEKNFFQKLLSDIGEFFRA